MIDRHIIVPLLAAGMALTVLTACGGGGKAPSEAPAEAAADSAGAAADTAGSAAVVTARADIGSSDQPRAGKGRADVYDTVEEMPEFPGGNGALMKFISETIKYPEAALKEGREGRVVVQFVVESDGTVADPTVVRRLDPDFDGEALRVVSAMPKWIPGRQGGKAVAVRYTIPVTFRMS